MRRSTFVLCAALLCAPAYATQAGATDGQNHSPVAPGYPAPPQMTAPAPVYPAAPAAIPIQASALMCRPATGSADGRLMLCEPQLAVPTRGWGEGAGIAGLTLGALALGVGFLSEMSGSSVASMASLYMMMATGGLVPMVAAGSRSSRRGAGVEGVPGLRVFGWIAYAASFAVPTIMLLTRHLADHPFMVIGALDAAALFFHGVDALVAGKAARAKVEQLASLEVAPYLGPIASADGGAGASLGLAGRF